MNLIDRFTGTTPNPVNLDGELTVHFSNAALANTTVTISLQDLEQGASTTVDVTLDAEGSGTAGWKVPVTWGGSVVLQHSTSDDHTVAVTT